MMAILFSYIAILVPLAGLDLLWVLVVMKASYQKWLAAFLAPNVNVFVVVPLYLIFAAGLWYFAVAQAESWKHALFRGGFFGFVAYGLYDLTNWATFAGWPVMFTAVDMGWGIVLSAVASCIGYGALQFYIK